ncbi:seryl-tRNA synthetase [Spiroplasma sabaudiense Ar-1343]|uniref:Serine--tRNA ligase n=1 Tax=Spiroplasma sabaudiense Ar-1343 TaxID=1276257 RepID=W6A8S4_9MOLU|nr:serine--tRNA ligase [Spiroplasma sabaudiense]AHI53417.1 seryl-tRNA synthetase [Spiroplasma sabaudiense Ar-1343]
MLDINKVEADLDGYIKQLSKRNADFSVALKKAVEKNTTRKDLLKKVELMKAEKNQISKLIPELIKEGKNEVVESNKANVVKINSEITKLDKSINLVNEEITEIMAGIPNLPHSEIKIGNDDNDNFEIKRAGLMPIRESSPEHWDIATTLGIADFDLGSKISGSRFMVYKNAGSKMVRAIIDILLSHHSSNGYQEFYLPLIVNEINMFGTGQLPKFADDAYKVGDQYLIPTAEVPLTNIHRDEIINPDLLPIKYTAYTQCFRQEAGSAGRDTKGMIRLHQFNKVELVKIVKPEDSMLELEKLLKDAEDILNLFKLPYRVVELCGGDLGFSATKTYDLEVWFPSQAKYREISSCSNCGDFQARRMKTRYKGEKGNDFVHTLNGSGVAIDRLIAAILENYWDGEKLVLPDVLQPYFNNEKYLTKN